MKFSNILLLFAVNSFLVYSLPGIIHLKIKSFDITLKIIILKY